MRKIQKILLLASISAATSTFLLDKPTLKAYAVDESAYKNQITSNNKINISKEETTNDKKMEGVNLKKEEELESKKTSSNSNVGVNKDSKSLAIQNNLAVSKAISVSDAVNKINAGNGDIAEYRALRLTRVNRDNLKIINKAVMAEKSAQGRDLTLPEIMDITLQTGEGIQEAFENINNGTGTVDDYKLLGADFVNETNIDSVNKYFNGKGYTNVLKFQDVSNKAASALRHINDGEGTESDYSTLEIGSYNSIYSDIVKKYISKEKESKGRDLTIAEIASVVNTTIDRTKQALYNMDQGVGTLDDYKFIGADNVDELHREDVNSLAMNQRWGDVTTALQEINNILGWLSNINNGVGDEPDYGNTHIIDTNKEFFDYGVVNAAVLKRKEANSGQDLTINQIKEVVDSVRKLTKFYERVIAGQATAEDFKDAGFPEVAQDDVATLNDMLKDESLTSLQDKLRSILDSVKNINAGTGSIDDYNNLKTDAVDLSKLQAVNDDILKLKAEKGRDLTIAEIRESVKKTIAASKVVKGDGEVKDFIIIGINGVTEINIQFINEKIKENGSITIININIVIKPIVELSQVYVRIVSGEGTPEDYKKLGINNVDEKNVIYINADLKNKKYAKVQDIQVRVDSTISNIEIINKISSGNGIIDDYINIGITDIYEDILVYVNADLKIQNYKSVDEIISRIQARISSYEALMRINLGEAITDDFTALGLTDITDGLLIYVSTDLQKQNYKTIDEVVNRVQAKISIYKALMQINLGKATVADYNALGLSQININILIYVNADLQGKKFVTVDEVKAQIEKNIQIYKVLLKISSGEATIEDYRAIGVNEIIDYNISYVNIRIKNANISQVSDAKMVINIIINNMIFSNVGGVITDSTTGKPLQGVEIRFRIGANNTTGDYFTKNGVPVVATIDAQGKYSIQLPEGCYTVEIKKDGYVTQNFVITSDGKAKNVLQNIQLIMIQYTVSGVVRDAETGNPLEGVAIRFRVGENNKSGDYYSVNGTEVVVYTDAQGKYSVSLAGGTYTAEAKKDGNITIYSVIISSESAEKMLQDMVLSKTLPENQYRVVLSWGSNPHDLDSYFTGKTGDGQSINVYYQNKTVKVGDTVVTLDRDDTDGNGPETVTFVVDQKGNYTYSVYDLSDSSTPSSNLLSLSGATVKVYKGNQELKTYVIPTNASGITWNVFKVENGQIVDVNTITSDKK
ncbi:carboxypeptidase regulatory-like domain-containing protein [Clostridium cibarium]|uniref:Carboxypeptidase regulatory-like domain-containing protein n=1 Tax=Clostridium cibarium TaxID=2762247 RepID=A0ABR8PP71_9CLOT|nr:carboxypeptidase regulatory-like domain-containing protein [Clostridium cibarium]MBD7909962.1 carboxypeptidase regulatory-like domain-containing protein [Clostridium cibarium]